MTKNYSHILSAEKIKVN